jgi:uncharacterized protein (TIGR03435 family)
MKLQRCRMKVAVRTGILIASLSCVHTHGGEAALTIGDAPPPLTLGEIVHGPPWENITWDKLQGQVVVLEFWNTRCAPCIRAIPHLTALEKEFRSKGVVFLGVSDDNSLHLKSFLKSHRVNAWLALDRSFSPTRTAFGVSAIPQVFVISEHGKIAAITHPQSLDATHLQEILDGKPTTLPVQRHAPEAPGDAVSISNISPARIEISIRGPLPMPNAGAFNSRRWEKPDYQFFAEKAFLRDVLANFFDVSPKLIIGKEELPGKLYDVSAAGPSDELQNLRTSFREALKINLGISVITVTQAVEVYEMTAREEAVPGRRKASVAGGGGGQPGGFRLTGSEMESVRAFLEEALDKPVVDETQLSGLWDVDIKWRMSESDLEQRTPDPQSVVQAAREQLGLELKVVRRSVPVLLIE